MRSVWALTLIVFVAFVRFQLFSPFRSGVRAPFLGRRADRSGATLMMFGGVSLSAAALLAFTAHGLR